MLKSTEREGSFAETVAVGGSGAAGTWAKKKHEERAVFTFTTLQQFLRLKKGEKRNGVK